MISFRSDYSQGAHPKVMEALLRTNLEHTDGYGMDAHCASAAELVRALSRDPAAAVHMMVGGTPCNVTLIAAALRPYEAVVSVRTGHAYFHETGAVEATGHRIIAVEGVDGKLTPEGLDRAWAEHEDEHTPLPRLAYISQPTELGTVYTRAELAALREATRRRNMYLYVDGARLGCALTAEGGDLTLPALASLCDAWYLGATKNGALFGEALVIREPALDDHFRWMIKRQCGLLAKGRLIGVQLEALLNGGEDCLYFELARHSNALAARLRQGFGERGVPLLGSSPTNQVFPVLPVETVERLEKDFFFYRWAPPENGLVPIRLVTGWGSAEAEVEAFLDAL